MLRRKWKPFKMNHRYNKTIFLPYNSPVRLFSAHSYGILHCTFNNTKSKLENLIFHNYNGSTGFLLWLIDSSSEQESDSNINFGLSSSDGFSSSATDSSEGDSRTGHHKPATLSQNGHGSKILKVRRVQWKPNVATPVIQHICRSASNHGN